MQVDIIDAQKDLKIPKKKVQALAKQVIALEGFEVDEVSIHFLDLQAMCDLHAEHFNDPSPTDCISFPLLEEDEHYRHLGDIFVCPAVAIEYANKHKLNAYDELTLYIVHGLLHLMGYDDMTKYERAKMRKAEKKHMQALSDQKLVLL